MNAFGTLEDMNKARYDMVDMARAAGLAIA
jgi:hypothetical protein